MDYIKLSPHDLILFLIKKTLKNDYTWWYKSSPTYGEMTIYNALITMSAEPGPRTLGLTVNNVDLWVQANDEMRRT